MDTQRTELRELRELSFARIDARFTVVDAKTDARFAEVNAKIDLCRADLGGRLDAVSAQFGEKLAGSYPTIRTRSS